MKTPSSDYERGRAEGVRQALEIIEFAARHQQDVDRKRVCEAIASTVKTLLEAH